MSKKDAVQKRWPKAEKIEKDQGKVYIQAFDLIHQVLHVCIIRDVIREYRYFRENKVKEYNVIMTVSHVGLENYAVQQLWKLFDKKNSVLNVWHLVENMPHPNLKTWFQVEVGKIGKELKNLDVWRHNIVSHRSEIGYFMLSDFEQKFPDRIKHEKRIKDFLLNLISQMKFEMQRVPIKNTKRELLESIQSYKRFAIDAREKVLRKVQK